MQKKVFFKISGQSLEGDQEFGIKNEYVHELAQQILTVQKKGYQIALMPGGGNIFRGRNEGQGLDKATGHYCGMMASCINTLAMADIFRQNGIKVKMFAAVPVPRFMPLFEKRKVQEALDEGYMVICAAGTGNPFCSHDLGAVIRALELDFDIVVKCTRVDGVYTADPEKDPSAKKYDEIHIKDALDQGLNVMDHSAIAMAMENKMPIYVCNIKDIDKRGTDQLKGTNVLVD